MTNCTYCDEGGATFCIRSHATPGGPYIRVMAHRACAQRHGVPVLYIEAMRADAAVLLESAALPPADVLETTLLRVRGHVQVLIPVVADAAVSRPRHDDLRVRASAGIGEAQARLGEQPSADLVRAVRHAQRLARSVVALTTHLAALRNAGEEP
ncbi:DUF6415 family natural product biosynthesis protein [Streptomyces sp. NRRL S-118]|uniref:DUF6415 family natural product biosynthesis protein n=1 Tax=Streptomyces sp. NRRL S-118 TaxID=1463881 RepID=UPI0004C9B629|nr:DUF6415 family natural product biosynthesis protein [Streptomyces sp. NRRL S-118]